MSDIDVLLEVLKQFAPIDAFRTSRAHLPLIKRRTTGNLKFNSIIKFSDEIRIGSLNTPAMRYAAITNKKWKRGNNPNENWVRDAVLEAERRLGRSLNIVIQYEDHEQGDQDDE